MAARAGVEPTTLRLKVIVSTKAPPRPTLGEAHLDMDILLLQAKVAAINQIINSHTDFD